MATNHKFKVVSKTVTFPTNNLKLFTVTGDVLVYIFPVIKTPFDIHGAAFVIGEADKPFWTMGSSNEDPQKRDYRAVSGDLYLNSFGKEVGSGVAAFYCVYAKLSQDGEVEEAE